MYSLNQTSQFFEVQIYLKFRYKVFLNLFFWSSPGSQSYLKSNELSVGKSFCSNQSWDTDFWGKLQTLKFRDGLFISYESYVKRDCEITLGIWNVSLILLFASVACSPLRDLFGYSSRSSRVIHRDVLNPIKISTHSR